MAYHARGHTYAIKHQYDQAISDFSKAIELNPRDAESYYTRAIAYFSKREYDKSSDDVKKEQDLGCKIHPGFLKALREASGKQK